MGCNGAEGFRLLPTFIELGRFKVLFSLAVVVACIGTVGGAEFAPPVPERMMAVGADQPRALFAAAETDAKRADGSDEETKTRKRTVVWSALYLVAGIALLGVFLIVVIVLWGIRLRQRNRTRQPPDAPFDPLWYLRKGANEKSEPTPDPDQKPDGTPP
jgi:hypothetical protein